MKLFRKLYIALFLILLSASFVSALPKHIYRDLQIVTTDPQISFKDIVVDSTVVRLKYTESGGVTTLSALVGKPAGLSKALNFDNSPEFAALASGNIDPSGATAWTNMGWANSDVASANNGICGWWDGANGVFLQSQQSGPEGLLVVAGGGTDKGSVAVDIDGDWFHYALVYDGSLTGNANRLKLYYNGAQQILSLSGTIPASIPVLSNSEFRIGDIGDGSLSRHWSGQIDLTGVWSRALTANDVSDSYASGNGLYLNVSNTFTTDGTPIGLSIEGLYHKDQASGTNVPDSSGNGRDATTNNMEDADWVPGKVANPSSDVMISGLRLEDSARGGVAGKITVGQSGVNSPEIVYDGYDQTFQIGGVDAMVLDTNGTLTIDNGNDVPALELISSVGQTDYSLTLMNSSLAETFLFGDFGAKLVHNAGGDAEFFGGADVGDGAAGKSLIVHRRADEFDRTVKITIDQFGTGYLESSSGLILIAADGSNISFGHGRNNNFQFGINAASGENPWIRHHGWLTSPAAPKYVQWQVDDTDDWFKLTRESADILGFDIQMPTHIGDGTNYTNFASDGLQTMIGTAKVIKQLTLPPAKNRTAGADIPPPSAVFGCAIGLQFAIGDKSYYEVELPYDVDTSETIEIEVHWFIDEAQDDPGGANEEQIQWQATYLLIKEDGTEAVDGGGTARVTGDVAIPGTAKFLVQSEMITSIPGSTADLHDNLYICIERIAVTKDDPTAEPILMNVEIEYISNKLGIAT